MTLDTVDRYVRRNVDNANLEALVTQETEPWIYAERPADTVLAWLSEVSASGLPWHAWRHGRIFGPDREFAWWRESPDRYTCRLLSVDVPGDAQWGVGEPCHPIADEAEATLLHGLWDEGTTDPATWSEARIPRYLPYPVENSELTLNTRVVLMTARYQGEQGDLVSRLLEVKTILLEDSGDPDAG